MSPVPRLRIVYHAGMSRKSTLAVVLVSLLVAATSPVRAEEGPRDALLTLEGEAALRARLWERLLLVAVRPQAGSMEDPALVVQRYGQAARVARVAREGRTEVLTAALVVADAAEVRLARTGQEGGVPARIAHADDATLLARLDCGAPCEAMPALQAAEPEAWGIGRLVFFLVPAMAGQPVLAHTASLGRAGEPFEAMITVAGTLAPGTVLFDPEGRVVAIVVRTSPLRSDRTLAAVMTLPGPEPSPEGGEAAATPGSPAAIPPGPASPGAPAFRQAPGRGTGGPSAPRPSPGGRP